MSQYQIGYKERDRKDYTAGSVLGLSYTMSSDLTHQTSLNLGFLIFHLYLFHKNHQDQQRTGPKEVTEQQQQQGVHQQGAGTSRSSKEPWEHAEIAIDHHQRSIRESTTGEVQPEDIHAPVVFFQRPITKTNHHHG
ncbi:hypothetical protein Dimus_038062 [Dionaea muscipula]